MKFIRTTIIAAASCISWNVFSQSVEESVARQVSPLTPNAASLGKYGDMPVSLYTGIPNINIPLYEVRAGGFTLPISLSYHASGVQVDDLPSWVGIGWTLNAGGMINRRMRGVEDYRMIDRKSIFADEVATIENPSAPWSDKLDAANVLADGKYDTESDIFSISTGTLSHKFFLDVDGNAHGMPVRKLQIIPEGSVSYNQGNHIYYARWRIKDETGVEYIFGRTLDNTKDEFEVTKNETVCGASSGDQEFINTWYLNQIKLPDGESIYFTYDYFYFCRENMPFMSFSPSTGSTSTSSLSTTYLKALRIKEITFPTGKIEFVPGDLRRDVAGDNVLDRIKIFSKRSGQYFEEKSLHFATNNPTGNTTSGDGAFRLALLSVTEFDKDGTPLSPYQFEYKHQPSETYNLGLPARLSFAQDLWGYYNGKTMNGFLFPNFIYLEDWYGVVVNGADRSVSPEKAQAGILKKITYPTKGTTQFFYESNVAKGITHEDATLTWGSWPTTPKPFRNPMWDLVSMRAAETTSQYNNVDVLNEHGNDFKYGSPFEIFGEGNTLTNVAVSSHIMYGENNTPCTATTPPGSDASFWECLDIILEKKGPDGQFYPENSTVYFNRSYGLTHGEYRIKLAWKDISPNDQSLDQAGAYAYVDLNWMGPTSPSVLVVDENTEFEVGGLRIAKIVDSDGDSGKEIVRWFDYHYDESDYDENLVPLHGSSGTIQNTTLHYRDGNFLNFYSNSFALQTSGGYVGYKKVTVSYGADKKGGRQVSYFTSAVDHPDGNLAVSKQWSEAYEPVEVDWRRGLNERVIDLKYENDAYTPVHESENHFTFLSQPSDPDNYHQINIRIPPEGGVRHSLYKTVSESFYMDQSVETTKASQGAVVTTTHFEQNPLNLAVSKTTTYDSKGDTMQVVTKYPVDYGNVENINTLRAGNIISVPIKTETTKNSKLVNGVVVKYTDLGQPKEAYKYENSNLVDAPTHSDNTIVPANYALRSQFLYNATGNKLKESKQSNNYPTAYIWGYDRSFPVVKIENIAAGQIPASVITNIEGHVFTGGMQTSDFQGDVDFLNAQVSDLRNNKDYRVTTYTYNTAFGLTSQTDPNGITTYFESDGYGRLHNIKDDEGNIIRTIRYHLKGQ